MKQSLKKLSFKDYFFRQIAGLESEGRFSTAKNYLSAWRSFEKFLDGRAVEMRQMDHSLIMDYQRHLQEKGLTRNSISFYNRIIRCVYNKAVEDELAPFRLNLFKNAYTGVDTTRKRALPREIIKRIIAFEPKYDSELMLTRDLFLFSIYTRGMCFVDMAFLQSRDVSDVAISYVRHKTSQRITIQIEPCIRAIIEKYADSKRRFIFPIVTSEDPKTAFSQYSYRLHRHNLRLKELGQKAGAPFPLSSYVARHSWATLARDIKIPLSLISYGMGHTSERTTRIYLDSLENSEIDKANSLVLRALK